MIRLCVSVTILVAIIPSAAGADDFKRTLHVAYLTPADREPIEDYQERLDRVMTDIQAFYAAGMKARGFSEMTFPLDRDDEGRLIIHVVKGDQERPYYTGQRGDEVQRLVREALALDGIDAGHETVIIFQNLILTEGNRLSADCPYYGSGDHRSGTAWVTDHEVLDTLNLGKTEPEMFDGERPYSVGKYNSVYIGGAAHELGHALGLPHVHATKAEEELGTTLMGSGNYTFRDEVREEGKGSFLSPASAEVLATHPLFRRSDELKDEAVQCVLEEVRCERTDEGMRATGRVESTTDPTCVIAFSDLNGGSDYDARSWVAEVDDDGRFAVDVGEFEPGGHQLRLTFCHPSGEKATFDFPFTVDDEGAPDHAVIELAHLHTQAVKAINAGNEEVADEHCRAALEAFDRIPEDERTDGQRNIATKLAELPDIAASEPTTAPGPAPADLDGDVDSALLCDLTWESAEVGWEHPARDRIPDEPLGTWLESAEHYHAHGLYAHAASRYVFRLGEEWERFSCSYGLQQACPGSVVFVVLGDGEELHRSDVITGYEEHALDLDVDDVDLLELVVETADRGNHSDCSIWFAPEIRR